MELLVKSVSAGYGSEKVLENIDLTIKEGETVFIGGRNGSGKTTWMKMVAALTGSGKLSEKDCEEIEKLLEMKVNLKLWVKVKENWRDSDLFVANFGYNKNDFKND